MTTPQRLHCTRRSRRQRPIPRGNHTIAAKTPKTSEPTDTGSQENNTYQGYQTWFVVRGHPVAGTTSRGDLGVRVMLDVPQWRDSDSGRLSAGALRGLAQRGALGREGIGELVALVPLVAACQLGQVTAHLWRSTDYRSVLVQRYTHRREGYRYN